MSSKFQRQLYDGTDCLASALMLNCCQFGCFIRNVPTAEYSMDNSDWMSQLRKANPSIQLRDVVIPGTHDSATFTFSKTKLFSAAGLTQNVDIYQQLSRGARYLDVRVASSPSGETTVYHGFLQGGKFSDVLSQITRFLEEHPQEFIVLDIVQEYGRTFHEDKRVEMFHNLVKTFGDKLWKKNDRNELLATKLVDLDKQVVIVMNNRIYNFEHEGVQYSEKHVDQEFGLFSAQRWMRSKWHNTRDIPQLFEWNVDEVKKYGTQRDTFLNNQFVLTPGVGGVNDVLNLLVGKLSLRPVSFASKLYQQDQLDDFLRKQSDQPWNIIMLDYIDLAPALISFLISLNFSKKLTVTKAAVHAGMGESIDVTSLAQSFVKRGKVLYLTDIKKDFRLDFDEGKLTIAYKLGRDYRILDVDFDESTEILVGEYSQNSGVLVHIDTEHKPKGVYSGGTIVEDKKAAAANGTVLEYTASADDVQFSIVR
jgi:hypothetical protein